MYFSSYSDIKSDLKRQKTYKQNSKNSHSYNSNDYNNYYNSNISSESQKKIIIMKILIIIKKIV